MNGCHAARVSCISFAFAARTHSLPRWPGLLLVPDAVFSCLMFRLFFVAQAEWEAEFDRYKAFPEWQQRRSMTLDEFKHIFFWEVRSTPPAWMALSGRGGAECQVRKDNC